jgi:DNA-binding NarL/FixJ family response regulator
VLSSVTTMPYRVNRKKLIGWPARCHPHVRILILSMYDNEQYFFEALKAGASGYVLKSVADRDLLEACRATLRGEPFLYAGAGDCLDPGLSAPGPAG